MNTESKFAELKEKEREARKQIIIDSALALFAKKPFYEVGMRDVADEAGVSPATLYRYFPSQEELFVEAFIQDISAVSREFENMVKKDQPATIEEFAVTYVDHLVQNESTFQMMTYILLKDQLDKSALAKFGSVTRIFFDTFERLLKRYGVEGDVRLFVHSFIASMTGIIMTFRNHSFKNKDQIREHILKITVLTADLYSNKLIRPE
ncbi:HTH-type transcriptional regulator [Desulfamplus magnetovallimortis]|uniref:HTH-type transcriptional regulator n=1 Tax=Desulfamplus magnetovallimortis TaxID=1246637 RepID=A0A1W1HDG0_9BACT|nr:TetR/AcrR family transcriptional regulator [Desulfamplus magnetovallimortis]SLM30531.1 HTH-type transcriptional regulator [Desulfamplus magnetovallimortis]